MEGRCKFYYRMAAQVASDMLELLSKYMIELPDEFAGIAPETRCCRVTSRVIFSI